MNKYYLRMEIYQPFAHYRDPKVMQDDYIPTLPLPPATTIAGMVSYMSGRKFKDAFNIGVIGSYKAKIISFTRGEDLELYENYIKDIKSRVKEKINPKMEEYEVNNLVSTILRRPLDEVSKMKKKDIKKVVDDYRTEMQYNQMKKGENFIWYKNKAQNKIMNIEVLCDVTLSIFLKFSNENDFKDVYNAFKEIPYYMSLGRKEDFAVFLKNGDIKEVQISEEKSNLVNAVEKNYLLKNTYIPVELKHDGLKDNKNDDSYFLDQGVLISLPKIYKDLSADKAQRKILHGHYIYVGGNGIYPKDKEIAHYKNGNKIETFCWLV